MSGSVSTLNNADLIAKESLQSTDKVDSDGVVLPFPTAHKVASTMIVFDWDDTILPSSWLSQSCGLSLEPTELAPEIACQLVEHEQMVIKLLTFAQHFGQVMIITNAETGWVQFSAQRFLPNVLPLVSQFKVVSARSTYEKAYPEPSEWKSRAFQDELHSRFPEANFDGLHVISFGDGELEREAVMNIGRELEGTPKLHIKSIKLLERPSALQLRKQLELVHEYFHYICTCDVDLDLMLNINFLG
jgi:hypothetical protein